MIAALFLFAAPLTEALPPPRLRPCCAFGYNLKSAIGGEAVPTIVSNVAAYYDLGQHSYLQPVENKERNGLIYTCRGGFVDVSHVRDYADWTRYLYTEIRPVLGSSVKLTLPAEGATKTLKLKAAPVPESPTERDALALQLAARVAYDLSLWHELATWYGFRSVPIFDERISAFSPEDLYSNMTGILVGMQALQSRDRYETAVDRALSAKLSELEPLSPEGTRRAFDVVEGAWWDRNKAVPDVHLVSRRRISTDTRLLPWAAPTSRIEDCKHRPGASVVAEVPTKGLSDLYELQFDVDYAVMPRVPRSEQLTQRELPWLTARASEEIRTTLGPLADREELSVEEIRTQLPESACGAHDPDCSLTRFSRQNGTKLFKLEAGTWSFISAIVGLTVADFSTRGGTLQIIDYRSAVERTGKYLMRAEALRTTGLLSACRKLRPDGSGETYTPLGFVNPIDEDCLPGSRWGVKLDLLDLIYDGRVGVFGLRPAEVGVAWNLLGNGFSSDYLNRRLVWSLNVLPEMYAAPGAQSTADFVVNTRFYYHHSLLASRLTLGGDVQLNYGALRTSLVGEAVVRLTYNQLLSFGSGNERTHTIVSVGFEGGVDWWMTRSHGIAPLNHKSIQLLDPVGPTDFYGVANFFVELSLPMLAI